MGKLNALSIQRTNHPGLYGDGNGLYLQVNKGGTKSWIFRYMLNKKAKAMGLGPIMLVSLAEARMKALECRKRLLDGTDPIEHRKAEKQSKILNDAKAIAFRDCAIAYINAHQAGWKNQKHVAQWKNTLEVYANPIIGKSPVQLVDTALIMRILEPIWYEKTETASRVRNRIELVLSWATVHGYRIGDNPARWRGHLDQLLPKRSSVQTVEHFAALPYQEIGLFIQHLWKLDGVVPLALEFQILTATRTGEILGANWNEISFENGIWTIPGERMKAKREHRVPLSPRALEILKLAKHYSNGNLIFPGRTKTKPLSNNAFLNLIKKRMNMKVTAHGFRSTFRDWAGERTVYPREVIEKCLAHSLKDATEAAYQRGDLILKRQALMNDWARYCSSHEAKPADLIEINFKQS